MSQLLNVSLLAMGGSGAFFGIFLAYASKKFAVENDERIEDIEEVLPGANCGACGYPGCSAYAEAVVKDGAPVKLCPVGGAAVAAQIGDIMGVSTEDDGAVMVAKVKCQGGKKCTSDFEYMGIQDCHAASALHGGPKSCKYACLGLGSCLKACPFDAIIMNENGVAQIDVERCTGCGICVKECPKAVIELVPNDAKIHVLCKNEERGREVKPKCGVGCIGCKICERACQYDAIKVENNAAHIDYEKCTGCAACVKKCPTKAIEEIS